MYWKCFALKNWIWIAAAFFLVLPPACSSGQNKNNSTNNTAKNIIAAYNISVDRSKLGISLNFYNFPNYLDPAIADKFEEVYGVKLILDYYDNNETMMAKLYAGGVGQYDLIVAPDFAASILWKKKMIDRLNHDNIPNLRNLKQEFRQLPFDPGNIFSVCYQWGTTGFGVRSDLLKNGMKDIDSWRVFFDPKYQLGPFTMLDDPRETIGAALKYLGYSVNSTNPKELKEAEKILVSQKSRLIAYTGTSTARDLLVSGDAVMVHNYSGDIYMAREELKTVEYVIPREGTVIWTDNIVIPVNAPHKYAAEVFINFLLDAQIGAQLTHYTHYASPNQASIPFINPELKNSPLIFPTREMQKNMEFLKDIGEAAKLYDEIWARLKATGIH